MAYKYEKKMRHRIVIFGVVLLLIGLIMPINNDLCTKGEKNGEQKYFVDDSNTSGQSDGTIEHPYPNIQDAINQAIKDKDKFDKFWIYVYNGDYYEDIVIQNIKRLKIEGEDQTATKIPGLGGSSVITILDTSLDIIIKNFSINSDRRQGIHIQSENTTIDKCIINTIGEYAIRFDNESLRNINILNCTLSSINNTAIYIYIYIL